MQIVTDQASSRQEGLSLTELLLIVAVIGVISAIAIPTISRLRDSAKKAAATQNAKNIAQMSEALAALGVAHVIPDSMGGAEATARLLREGVIVPEGPMAGERFILSGMKEKEIEETAAYLRVEYGTTYLRLVYSPPLPAAQALQGKLSGRVLLCSSPAGNRLSPFSLMSCLAGNFFNRAL
ncbi:MAG: type II secretion system protein [Verrucomicrobiales bacterium]|nr:type II secretion system protein [Verrucomicrobiales bacterium]